VPEFWDDTTISDDNAEAAEVAAQIPARRASAGISVMAALR
jgi:hypothetical protein